MIVDVLDVVMHRVDHRKRKLIDNGYTFRKVVMPLRK